MMETVEKYHLQLIALGKQICEELYSVDEKFSLWVGELDRIMKDAAKQLEVFFFQDAFEVLLNLTFILALILHISKEFLK